MVFNRMFVIEVSLKARLPVSLLYKMEYMKYRMDPMAKLSIL